MIYRYIIYQNFQKKILYHMNIFVTSNKIHKNLNKANSATGSFKNQIKIF